MNPLLVALHLGALHAHEKALTLLLAFGPFVLLAAVIVVRRRQDAAAELREARPEVRPEARLEAQAQAQAEGQRERY